MEGDRAVGDEFDDALDALVPRPRPAAPVAPRRVATKRAKKPAARSQPEATGAAGAGDAGPNRERESRPTAASRRAADVHPDRERESRPTTASRPAADADPDRKRESRPTAASRPAADADADREREARPTAASRPAADAGPDPEPGPERDREREAASPGARWRGAGRAIAAAAALTSLAAGEGIAPRLAFLAAIGVADVVVWAEAARTGGRSPRVRVVVLVAADLTLLAFASIGAAHFDVPALALVAAVAPVALHAERGGRDRGLALAAGAIAFAVTAVFVTDSHRGANAVGVVGGAAMLAWIAITVADVAAGQRAAEHVVRDAGRDLARFRADVVTTVSHEVRTPLTLIQGLTSTLARQWPKLTEAEKLDLIDTIALNVASLDSSILHFLDAARVARGELAIDRQVVDLASVVDDVETKLATAMAGHTVHTTLKVPTVWADADAVARIVEHLLTNAVRFSSLGAPILVRSEDTDAGVALSVTDRGRGIALEDRDRIWEPLWRGDVKDTGVSRGAGLGLSIVRDLAEAHGGTAAVSWTALGKGSTFVVTFPRPPVP